jgi:hypothetical protein
MTQAVSPFLAPSPAAVPPPVPEAPAPEPEAPAQQVGVQATDRIPAADLTEAYKRGLIAFYANERVPVRLATGELGTVAAHEASHVVDTGGDIVPHSVYERARLEKQYGGAGDTTLAGIAGAARGASLGLSDPLLVGGAEVFGGEAGKRAMQERLHAYKEVSPVASAVGEVAGMVAPALLTGGLSAEAEGAGMLARGAGRAAGIIGAPVEALSSVGRLGERAAGALLPDLGESLLGRAATNGITKGAASALEGAVIGGGQEISESSLGDHELTADSLRASMGHGALLAGLAGGALGAGGEVAGDLLDAARAKASPFLSAQAGAQMWKALDPIKKFTKEAEARFEGGASGLGRTLLDLDVLPKAEGLAASALTPQELLPRVEAKLGEAGEKIGAILDESGAHVKLKDIHQQIESILVPLREKAGFAPVVRAVEGYRDELFGKLGMAAQTGETAAPKLIVPAHLEGARAQIAKLAEAAQRGEQEAAQTLKGMGVTWSVPAAPSAASLLERDIPISALVKQKRALGDLVYKEAKALDPSMRVEQLRGIYGKLSDLELDAVDSAAKQMGAGGGRAELLQARKNYQALSIAKKALDETSARMQTNRNLGMSEYLTAGMAAASGHILAAPVVAIAHKVARARGNAFLAATSDRLSALQTLAKRSAEVDSAIGKGVRGFLSRGKSAPAEFEPAAVKATRVATGSETAREEYARRVADIESGQSADHAAPVAALAGHAPNVAAVFTQRAALATTWLASQVPKPPAIGSGTPSDQEIHTFLAQARAVDDPVDTVAGGLARGNLTTTQIEAVKMTYPSLYVEIQRQIEAGVRKEMAKDRGRLPYPMRRDLALLFDMPDWSMSPEGVKTLQANTQVPAGGAGGGKSGPQGGPAPKRPVPSGAQQLMSGSERLAGGQIRET